MSRRIGLMGGLSCAVIAGVCGLPSAAGEPTIREIAPASSVVVVGVDDFASARASFEAAGFAAIWNDPQVQRWVDRMMEDGMGELDEKLDELGFDRDDFGTPTGAAGLALFIESDAVDAGASEYHLVAMADFGENAQVTHELIERVLEEGVDEGDVTLEEDAYRDATVWTITEVEDEDDGDEMEEWEDWDDDGGMEAWESVYYTRSGNYLMVSSSLSALEVGIDRMAGDAGESVNDSAAFTESMGAIGGRPEMYVVGLVGPWVTLSEAIDEMNERNPPSGPPIPPITSILEATGLAEVESFGMGVNFDTPEAAIEQTLAVMVPERRGLMGLIPDDDAGFTSPDFVPANASGLTMVQVELRELLPTLQGVVSGLPPAFQNQAMGPMRMAGAVVGPLLENLGPEVYVMQSIERPFTVDSQQSVVAITSSDTDALRNGIASLLQQFPVPLEQRDFAGNTIWEMPDDMGGMGPGMGGGSMPVIGVGAGHLFVGTVDGVEAAMRTASNADAPRLADEARFQSATRNIRNSGLSFSWSNLRDSLEYMRWTIENRERIMRAELREQFGEGPEADEQIEEMLEWMDTESPAWLEELPEASVIFDRLGDTVGEMRVTPRGLIGTFKTLRAE